MVCPLALIHPALYTVPVCRLAGLLQAPYSDCLAAFAWRLADTENSHGHAVHVKKVARRNCAAGYELLELDRALIGPHRRVDLALMALVCK
jgi:hypothetical protein